MTGELAFTWPHEAGCRRRSDCFSFPFLDCLEEAGGEHLEQPGRYHPAAQVSPLVSESQVPGVNTRQYGDTMGTHHQCHASAGGGGCGMGSLELLCCTCGNLGDPDLFLEMHGLIRTSQEGGHPSHLVPAHAAVGSFSRPNATTQIFR